MLLVAILVAGGTITAIASTGSSAGTNPAPVTTPYHPAFDAANFGGPIDNPWLPLRLGTVLRYRGVGDDGKTRELNTVRVTHRKKRIMGVEATVVLDQVSSEGKPEERTFDWYAQDKEGNVWYLGEDSSNFEHGRWVKDDGSWQAGVGNGQPGIIMLAHPHRGDAYRQEYSPGHAVDQAQVLRRRRREDAVPPLQADAAHARVQHDRQAVRAEVARPRRRRDQGAGRHDEQGAVEAGRDQALTLAV